MFYPLAAVAGLLSCRHLPVFFPRFARSMASGAGPAEEIFQAGLRAVQPKQLISKNLEVQDGNLHIGNCILPLNHNVHIVGFGKAALGFVNCLGHLVKDHIVDGIVSCPDFQSSSDETLQDLVHISPALKSHITVFRGPTNNLPNETVLKAAKAIHDLAKRLKKDDLLLTVITGGGSALLTLPKPGLELEDVITTTRLLANAGCDIVDLNSVRKQLDILKGGGLAKLTQPAKTVSLILSDVIGDPVDIIAAGPTVLNTTGPQDALNILAKYGLMEKVPHRVVTALKQPQGPASSVLASNFILGSNRVALLAAAGAASEQAFVPVVLSHSLSGRTEDVAELFCALASAIVLKQSEESVTEVLQQLTANEGKTLEILNTLRKRPSRLCFLAGGESTVEVPAHCGVGGRMAQCALKAAIGLTTLEDRPERITLLAGATDGLDGPTQLAGAWVTPQTMLRANELGLNALKHLQACDAYGFFQKLGGEHIRPGGLTGTNVMDIVILTIDMDS